MTKTKWIPKSNSQKYSLRVIDNHPYIEVIKYFIDKNVQHGKTREAFDEHWFKNYGNQTNFWKLVSKDSIKNWKTIIDKMFEDDWVRENKCQSIKDILWCHSRYTIFENKKYTQKEFKDQCDIRLGFYSGVIDTDYNMYFHDNGMPKKEAVEHFKLHNDYRFKMRIQQKGKTDW